MTIDGEVNPFKMLAEEGVAEVNPFLSSLVEGVEARLDYDDVSELFHSQGALDQVRAGARKWHVLGVSVDGVEEKCEAAVTRLEAVLFVLSGAAVKSLCADGDPGKEPETVQDTEQRPTSLWERAAQFDFGCRGREREATAVG